MVGDLLVEAITDFGSGLKDWNLGLNNRGFVICFAYG